MDSHQFTVSKLYLPESAVCDFCQADIATAKAAFDESTTGEITIGKVTIHKIAILIFPIEERFFGEVCLVKIFRSSRPSHPSHPSPLLLAMLLGPSISLRDPGFIF